MIDIKILRENPDLVRENIKKKAQNDRLPFVDKILELDKEWRKSRVEADSLRAERNKVSEAINQAKKAKDEKKAQEFLKRAKQIPEKIAEIEKKEVELEAEIRTYMLKIPNFISKETPKGKDSSENKEFIKD